MAQLNKSEQATFLMARHRPPICRPCIAIGSPNGPIHYVSRVLPVTGARTTTGWEGSECLSSFDARCDVHFQLLTVNRFSVAQGDGVLAGLHELLPLAAVFG